jgi:hypothetical protein
MMCLRVTTQHLQNPTLGVLVEQRGNVLERHFGFFEILNSCNLRNIRKVGLVLVTVPQDDWFHLPYKIRNYYGDSSIETPAFETFQKMRQTRQKKLRCTNGTIYSLSV